VKEIVVLSGKGGTGKTSLTAVFASLMSKAVLVDCDVDAANLHLLLNPLVEERHDFVGGAKARVDTTACNGCGLCIEGCRFEAIRLNDVVAVVNPLHCEGCGICARICPVDAISIETRVCGQWFLSRTRNGPMFHARLAPGQDNSGKLVSTLRQSARTLAHQNGAAWILVDGPPGAGCPVISSLTGGDYVVMVTEPTLSGSSDLRRAVAVADHFRVPTGIIINKADINPEIASRIEEYAAATGRDVLGRICYDPAFTRAQLSGSSVLQAAGADLRLCLESVWRAVERAVQKERSPFAVIQ
jgi:MinD superfamily P-loop ATPase